MRQWNPTRDFHWMVVFSQTPRCCAAQHIRQNETWRFAGITWVKWHLCVLLILSFTFLRTAISFVLLSQWKQAASRSGSFNKQSQHLGGVRMSMDGKQILTVWNAPLWLGLLMLIDHHQTVGSAVSHPQNQLFRRVIFLRLLKWWFVGEVPSADFPSAWIRA